MILPTVHERVHDLVAAAAARCPDAPAVTSGSTTVSYGELHRLAREAGAGIAALGVRPGERVGIFLDKRIETVTAMLGVSMIGAVCVPINPLLRPPQLAYIVDHCAVRVLVTGTERLATARDELAECKSLEHVVVVGPGDARPPGDRIEIHDGADVLRGGNPPVARGLDTDVAAILYTSGSTGRPKGVVLSHRNLLAGAAAVSAYLCHTADDRILSVLPLSFDAGLSQLTTTFAVGAQVVLVNYLLPDEVVRLCARHRITGLTCVPPLWAQLAERPWPAAATAHLRYFANTGGRMPRPLLDRLRATFPAADPYLMYGLTEAFRSTYLDPAQVNRRPNSIGKAIPNAEILVVRPDGTECAPGEEGELVHRGALVALGYWNDPAATAERFRPAPGRPPELCLPEPAVWSGDVVVRDEEGFLYFVGRRDEMIKTSGYRVSPTEIEEVVHATGLVGDAVALGVPDERLGQRVVLVVGHRDGTPVDVDALLARLRADLPRYMLPGRVEVRRELPRSPNGKLDRNRIRAELEAAP